MANELVLVYETQKPISFTCIDGAGIEKGSIVKLADPMTVAITAGDHDVIGGVLAEDKISGDGKTKVAVYRGGIFRAVAGTAGVTTGRSCDTDTATSAANKLAICAANAENVFGISMETVAAGESFLVELRPTTMVLA